MPLFWITGGHALRVKPFFPLPVLGVCVCPELGHHSTSKGQKKCRFWGDGFGWWGWFISLLSFPSHKSFLWDQTFSFPVARNLPETKVNFRHERSHGFYLLCHVLHSKDTSKVGNWPCLKMWKSYRSTKIQLVFQTWTVFQLFFFCFHLPNIHHHFWWDSFLQLIPPFSPKGRPNKKL